MEKIIISAPEANKILIQEAFRHTVEARAIYNDQIARYFSRDYARQVDGKTINYDQFVSHLQASAGL